VEIHFYDSTSSVHFSLIEVRLGKSTINHLSTKRNMVDTLTKKQRSKMMSKVRSRDTKPEWVLRCGLHRLGFRYRIKNDHLPGSPDLVFPKFHAAVFVHGCYWHRHPGCKDASMPKSNVTFWERKFAENIARDRRAMCELEKLGWRTLVVWQCELTKHTVATIKRVADWLKQKNVYDAFVMNSNDLLSIAEKKVRYRISSYDN
jgi:DNA mismatch endonuclease (patch repair protein)